MYLKLVLTAIFWGGTFIAGRVVSQQVSPFSAAFFRFIMASLCLLLVIRLKEGRFPLPAKQQLFPLFLLGLTGIFAYNYFFFKGLKLVEAGRASVIVAQNPIVIALLQWGDRHAPAPEGPPVQVVDRENGRPIAALEVRADDGRVLRARDVWAKAT